MPSTLDARDDLRIEATARWAFQLSYFLLADRRDALSVLYQAVARLYVTALAQKKRQAKRPKREVHKKLNLTPGPLLQYLIYLCAETYEEAVEREHGNGERALTLEDMIVRYIKHLTMLYLEHNSFYAAVGQSCILFDLGTSEAARLYEALVQGSPAHLDTKGDYSVRDAKRELRRRLAGRFGQFLTTYDGTRKEQLFVGMSDAARHFRFVKLCQHRLRPLQETDDPAGDWHLPAKFDMAAYDLAELQYDERNSDPNVEHAAELRRVHVVTHPCCWARLLRALRFNYSRRRMVLPEFNLTSDEKREERPPHERHTRPDLTPAELAGLAKMLGSGARRRKGLFASSLSVTVDGEPRCSWSIDRDRTVKISVERDARVLAISTHDEEGELLLAQYLLKHASASSREQAAPAAAAVTIEGGQEFSFTVSTDAGEAGDGFMVTIGFRETKLHRVLARYLASSFGRFVPRKVAQPARLKTAAIVSAILFAVLLTGWWLAQSLRRNTETPGVVTKEKNVAPPAPSPLKPESAPSPDKEVLTVNKERRTPLSTGRAASRGVALTLQDGGRVLSIDGRGRSAGLEGLPPAWRRAIEAALLAGRVDRPAVLEGFNSETETLLGEPGAAAGVNILGPVGVMVESDRPLFRWRASTPDARYVVAIFDRNFKMVAQSPQLSATEWTPSGPLRRGNTYVWKVTTLRGAEAIVSPAPPAPEARFRVLSRRAADELERARRLHPDSHLTLGVLYARSGLLDEAEREFRALVESNPGSSVALRLLRSVRERRGSR